MLAFFDTNVLIYAAVDEKRSRIVNALLDEPFVISVQSLNEYANVARRKLKLGWPIVRMQSDALRAKAALLVSLTPESHDVGVAIAERYQLSVYDAMIVASALLADCETLYSEDMQDGMIIEDRMIIRNPFA